MRGGGWIGLQVALTLTVVLPPAVSHADTLVVCTEASPDFLNAQLSTTSFDVSEQVFDRLVELKPGTSELVPGLAESWTISPDGRTYTFKLRRGVKWQASAKFKPTREMNADDVVFSFKRMFDRSNPFFKSANGNFPEFAELIEPSLESVERTDDETVVFTLKAPLAPLVSMLSMQAFSIISAEYAGTLEKSGKLESLDRDLIGTGPFSFVQYQKDTSVRFRAFPDFWGTLGNRPDRTARVENLVFAITPDPAVRYAKLRANECQIARYPNPADLPSMRADPDLKVQETEIAAVNYVFFNNSRAPFNDRRVRLALAMAIDLDHLVGAVFQGGGTRATALVPPSLWGHDASLKPYPYDPEAAKQLLAEAGYPNGFATELWAIPVGTRLHAQRASRRRDDPVGLGEDRGPGQHRQLRVGRGPSNAFAPGRRTSACSGTYGTTRIRARSCSNSCVAPRRMSRASAMRPMTGPCTRQMSSRTRASAPRCIGGPKRPCTTKHPSFPSRTSGLTWRSAGTLKGSGRTFLAPSRSGASPSESEPWLGRGQPTLRNL